MNMCINWQLCVSFFGLSVKLILIMLQPLTHNRSFFDDRTSVLNILLLGGQEWANPGD